MAEPFVTLRSYPDPIEAGMVCDYLRSCGIEVEFADTEVQSGVFGPGNPVFAGRLLVRRDQAADAARLLRELKLAAPAPSEVAPAGTGATPVEAGGYVSSAATTDPVLRAAHAEPEPPDLPSGYDGYFHAGWNRRERAAETAYRALVLSWYVPLIWIYGAWHLATVIATPELTMIALQRRHAAVAAACLGVRLTIYAGIALLLAREIWRG